MRGKAAAEELRSILESRLSREHILVINLAGVKDCTPGFARDSFGMLYLRSQRIGARIKFIYPNEKIRPVILAGVVAAIKTKE